MSDTVRVRIKVALDASMEINRSTLRAWADSGALSTEGRLSVDDAPGFMEAVVVSGADGVGGWGYEAGELAVRVYPEDGSGY